MKDWIVDDKYIKVGRDFTIHRKWHALPVLHVRLDYTIIHERVSLPALRNIEILH